MTDTRKTAATADIYSAAYNWPTEQQSIELCAHCGGDARGYAHVTYEDHSVRVCHHETRDCYQAITVWGETLGHPIEPEYVSVQRESRLFRKMAGSEILNKPNRR